ncbi:MAG TPA: hypothetical protein VIX89_01215 [Bryobacteraceae bacterium]
MISLSNAETFLSKFGLSLDRITASVGEISPWETVLFGGSIPEGLANSQSDIDLLLLGDTELIEPGASIPPIHAGDFRIGFQPNLGPLRLQVETVPIGHLEVLARQMAEAANSFIDPERAKRVLALGELDLRLLHRVCAGIPIKNPALAESWRARLRCGFLPSYMLASMIAQQSNLLEDAAGEAGEGRRESSLWMLKHALTYGAGALLASVEETNPNAKWRIRLLQVHREKVGAEIADALLQHLVATSFSSFDSYYAEAVRICEEVTRVALSRNAEVRTRREKMLARSKQQGILLPGLAAK